MNTKPIRLRFAPSPTGGLHIGGIRTALFAYLFAKKNNGTFILRIEDTDQGRYVSGAEQYIIDALNWCGIKPDEGPHLSKTKYAPYRQSERKEIYLPYAEQLIQQGNAYYAFDSEEELALLKKNKKTYNHLTRHELKNSLTLSPHETSILKKTCPYVVRFKNIPHEQIEVSDIIRGKITFDSSLLDDKVLLKSDLMPTYHLAVVVDDYLMEISHVFRGEEWLPSSPVHTKLWSYLGWQSSEPEWLHLPLILSPSGEGKLSKRESKKMGFPTFPLSWEDKKNGESYSGFKEMGFLPEGLVNTLALIGWSSNDTKEILSLQELIATFDRRHIHKSSARFDYEKSVWINGQHLQRLDTPSLVKLLDHHMPKAYKDIYSQEKKKAIIEVLKERCNLINDFWTEGKFFFEPPLLYDENGIILFTKEPSLQDFFEELKKQCNSFPTLMNNKEWETTFNQLAAERQLKTGKVLLPFRILLTGGKFGPGLFDICHILGAKEVKNRISKFLIFLSHR